MVTPFDEAGEFDPAAAADLARWLIDRGVEGLVLAGTTGESPTLSDNEKLALFRSVREAVTVPLIAGTGSNDTAHSVELTKQTAETGVDAVLAVTPYYNRPSQAGLVAHFTAIAESTDLPVMLYDIPVRTGTKIETGTILQLAHDVANITSVKDAAGSPSESARLIAAAPDDFELYSGDDALTLSLLAVGAVGVVSVAGHWCSREFAPVFDAVAAGDPEGAAKANAKLFESFAFESTPAADNLLAR